MPIFGLPSLKDLLQPVPFIGGALSTTAKIGLGVAGGAIGALALGGAKQYLQQSQTGIATAPTYYQFYQTKGGGPQSVYDPSGGSAQVDQKQTAAQTTPDYLQWLLIGGMALAAFYLFTRRKK